MIAQLKDLARDTLVRDVLFSSEVSPLVNNCTVTNIDWGYESQFLYNGVILMVDDSTYIPSEINDEILSGIFSLCPLLAPEWAILNLVPIDASVIKLSALNNINPIGLQLSSLLHKLFVRCYSVSELQFEYIDLTLGFISHHVKPRAYQYTKISLSHCTNIKNKDITMLLENCENLATLNVMGSTITDAAFTNVYITKHACNSCGIKNSKPLKLSVLNLSECSKLTTRSIRKIVELCGPSLQCLYIGQCSNIYVTALWYLSGLFKGKENFLNGNFVNMENLECACEYFAPFDRGCHIKDSTVNLETSELTRKSHYGSTEIPIDGTLIKNSDHTEAVIPNQISNLAITDTSLSSVFGDIEQPTTSCFDSVYQIFNAISELCDVQSTMLESILNFTSSEKSDDASSSVQTTNQEITSSSNIANHDDHDSSRSDLYFTPEPEYITLDECKQKLIEIFLNLKASCFLAWDKITKIMNLKFDDVNISSHILLQEQSKISIKSCSHILNVLNSMCQIVYTQYAEKVIASNSEENTDVFVDAQSCFDYHGEPNKSHINISESDKLEIQSILETVPLVRDNIVYFVQLMGQMSSEIKLNELLRIRLKSSIELEAIQREELNKINTLNDELDVLQGLHAQHLRMYNNVNGLHRQLRDIDVTNEDEVVDVHVPEGVEEPPILIEPPNMLDTDEEQGPELFKLLETEILLLLQHSRYAHCPDCCMNAYRPRITELDISGIKYQSDEIAKTALKTFVTINQGLKILNLSWYCVDNETIDYVAKCSPDLKSVSLRQCESLSSPVLSSFANHDLEVLDLFGICWIHDHGLLDYLGQKMSSLTSLCLAEASITDASLVDLSKYASLKNLDLSWCDDITDYGISIIVRSNANVLTSLSVRQCSIGTNTLKSIGMCSKLVKLDVSTAIQFTDETWMPMALNMPYLEDLDVGWVSDITNHMLTLLFTHCPRLKRICLDGHKEITTEPFSKILVTKPGKIEEDTNNWMRSAQYLPAMKYISLQYCNDMDDEELMRIVVACKGSLVIKDYYGDDLVA